MPDGHDVGAVVIMRRRSFRESGMTFVYYVLNIQGIKNQHKGLSLRNKEGIEKQGKICYAGNK